MKVKHFEPAPVAVVSLSEENGKVEIKRPETPVQVATEINNTPVTVAIESTVDTTNGNNGNDHQQNVVVVEEADIELAVSEPELEPLVVDSEEQELQFDDNSDIDSHKGSPVLTNRCATRRSQTRNIPTPKTPRVNDQNGEEKEQIEVPNEQNGCVAEKQDAIDNKEHHKQEDAESNTLVLDANMETPPPTEENLSVHFPDGEVKQSEINDKNSINLSVESCESALSTQVNVGGDVTREVDLTLPDENSFLNTAKDLTVVETLRRMSSRRGIRSGSSDYRRTLLKSQAEKYDNLLQQQRASMERITSTKRKTRSKTPENPKRFKTESSPGFFSYISSPLSMLRNRFSSGESMSASTPKLTGYREQEAMEDPELSKIEDSKAPVDKKRCVIM